MKQIDIIEIIPECVLLSFLLIISFSLIKKRKLFKSLKTKYLLQVYFAILIIESIDRLYVIVNDSYFFSTSFTNFSYADTCFYLFLSENLIKKRKYFNYIVLFFVFTINFLYVESHRRYFLLIDYIFNLLVLIYFFYLLKSFTGEKSKRFKIENRFFTKFIYMMLFYMSLSYIIPISINILSVLAPN
ncbi:membrane hypothetical protein [Tenacibaculum sp. 190524A02b]|uniref:Uncharacterized protein n=1 Tax=Tenacibaculum vairaonense TaxID=3137860 RepID=A0ABP1FD33_9FLAO